jgi:hypothetical protein
MTGPRVLRRRADPMGQGAGMSGKRKPKRASRRLPAHECDDHEHVMHFCSDPNCSDSDCPNTDQDIRLCGRGWGDLQSAMQMEQIFDCVICSGDGTFGLRIGRHWLGEPRLIWRCTNGCPVAALREALLQRGIHPGCLGDYGLDGKVYHLDSEQPTALYRWYDAPHLLLYVGISDDLAGRVKGHVRGSSWMDFAVSSTIERYPTRTAALHAEEAAIKTEQPIFNFQHNSSPEARQRLVDYLIKHNRLDLLAPAVSRG